MKSTRFLFATILSVVLHWAAVAVLVVSGRFAASSNSAVFISDAEHARLDEGSVTPQAAALPVEVEPTGPSPEPASRVMSAPRESPGSRDADPAVPRAVTPRPMSKGAPMGSEESPQHPITAGGGTGNAGTKEPVHELAGEKDAGTPRSVEPMVNHDALRQAMQAAASHPSSGVSLFTQPIIRVDPREKNLDRAWARAFAWAFATDRSFFSVAPVGRARFVVELADDGRIREVFWAEPPAPSRMKELVLRMVKLLSINHFSPPSSDSEYPRQRGFEMTVTESHLSAPKQDSAVEGQVGDIGMLGAGETPTLGHPSNPVVADMTGRKVSCLLKILEPLPRIP